MAEKSCGCWQERTGGLRLGARGHVTNAAAHHVAGEADIGGGVVLRVATLADPRAITSLERVAACRALAGGRRLRRHHRKLPRRSACHALALVAVVRAHAAHVVAGLAAVALPASPYHLPPLFVSVTAAAHTGASPIRPPH